MTEHNHNILLLSSSRAGNEDYLEHAMGLFNQHFTEGALLGKNIVFVPYAGVTIAFEEYTRRVKQALPQLKITGIHEFSSPKAAIAQAEAVLIGGGNTFRLLSLLYQHDLICVLKQKVNAGMPYIGWSAGANISGKSICTTNDMPIVEPPSLLSLGLIDCQLNPHYTDHQTSGHNGETRDQRLSEFTALNPSTPVIAIREGTALSKHGEMMTLIGALDGYVFLGDQKHRIQAGDDLSRYC